MWPATVPAGPFHHAHLKKSPDLLAKIPLPRVDRDFARSDIDQLWATDIERHEALWNRAVMKGHRLRALAGACSS
jgi:hypothetical protein